MDLPARRCHPETVRQEQPTAVCFKTDHSQTKIQVMIVGWATMTVAVIDAPNRVQYASQICAALVVITGAV